MAIRRWRVCGVMLAAVLLPAALCQGAGPIPYTVQDFEKADAKDLPSMAAAVLKWLPPASDVLARNTAAKDVCHDFGQTKGLGVNSTRPEVRLNAAIIVAGCETLSSDQSLMDMLGNNDQAVRYYGAKGLRPLAPLLKKVGAPVRVIAALEKAAKAETSSIVQQEIIRALIEYEAADALVGAADSITTQMQANAPEVTTLQTEADAFNVITAKIGTLPAAAKGKLAPVAVNSASYALQHYRAAEVTAKGEGKDVAPELTAATLKLIDAAVKAAGAATGQKFKVDVSKMDTAEFDLRSAFGSPGGTGKVPGIPAPGVIKTGG